jgi:hypothetical protein
MSAESRPSANTNINHCIQYMIRYLQRTQQNPNVRNPLGNGSLRVFTSNIFQSALTHCMNRNVILNQAIRAIRNEIANSHAWSQWALDNSSITYTTRHTPAERNALISELQELLETLETP